ncbi:TetR family transcriptional regulator [Actinomadura barringtoniae]|uniref:TetR family transcriptional regulator n=1 Tax=Actinomadura barringtoniae TaxID=1427535 RepID=A0A939P9H8_9ACTN|nr:TetR family transcriptional regulator [Actinomadura barringtoniae]MBO2445818.1 TetR family transcriptional regulator [Actinomadura barringtoniae]
MKDDTRTRILEVALDLFASRGFHATSLREIAERLGLTKTAVLYHFPSKQDIVSALAEPLLRDMKAALDAATRLDDPIERRWAVIEGLLEVWLTHRGLLRMQTQDLALAADGPVFESFRDTAVQAEHLIAGPDPDLAARVRAVQAFAVLSDPVVMLADESAEALRPVVLEGVQRLLAETPPPRSAPRPQPEPPAKTPLPPPAKPGRGRGRPAAMNDEMIERARRMHASGEHGAEEIARALGVSRATVYRHLGQPN